MPYNINIFSIMEEIRIFLFHAFSIDFSSRIKSSNGKPVALKYEYDCIPHDSKSTMKGELGLSSGRQGHVKLV